MGKPGFNLRRAKKNRRAIDHLRSLSEDCAGLRPSDLDGMSEEEMHKFLSGVKAGSKKQTKTAVHGTGETWTPVGLDYNPYRTSPLVNTPPPDDRFRQLPGAGTNNTNDADDKNTRGETGENVSTPNLERLRIERLLEETKGPEFIIRKRLLEHEEPNEEAAKRLFGEEGESDGKSVYVRIRGYENALRVQKTVPGSTVEPKGE